MESAQDRPLVEVLMTRIIKTLSYFFGIKMGYLM